MSRKIAARLLVAAAAAVSVGVLAAGPAVASTDDGFAISTNDGPGCGVAEYVDYGAGASGGGDNDDYIVVHDFCSDGHGVEAYAWQNGTYLGDKYNGNGLAGAPVVWDPFSNGNVAPGDSVGLKVCLVDGPGNPIESTCYSETHFSVDG